ncbi:MAG: hypothetical protein WB699_06965, partial [Bacteroidota bacterium]
MNPMTYNVHFRLFDRLLCGITLAAFAWTSQATAQPYGFAAHPRDSLTEIMRTDLLTKSTSHFLSVDSPFLTVFWNSSEDWVFQCDGNYLIATSTQDTGNTITLGTNVESARLFPDIVGTNRLILSMTLDSGGVETGVVKVLDKSTLDPIDSFQNEALRANIIFPSVDQSRLYIGYEDSLSTDRYIEAVDPTTHAIYWSRRLFDIGPPTSIKLIEDGKRGLALVGYNYPTAGNADNHYLVYDPVSGLCSTPAAFPFRSTEALLSSDCTKIIVQRIDFDSSTVGPPVKTGEVWVFDASSGVVREKLKFPAGGDVYVFVGDTASFFYHVNSTDAWIRGGLRREAQIKAGIFLPTNATSLVVRAKPSINFTSGDSVYSMVATFRWPLQYSGVSFGSITSDYGFTATDTPVTIGSYRYQKFSSSQRSAINWQAGQEYDLFTLPVNSMCGAEFFQLTNALSGGEWFVNVDYTDKTDSVFYQPIAQGFAFQNKSAGSGATAYTGERHAAIHGT